MVENPMLRQSFDITVGGRATRIVKDVAVELAATLRGNTNWVIADDIESDIDQARALELDIATSRVYGRSVIPWGLPYDVEVTGLEDGAVIVRSGLVNETEYAQVDEVNRAMVSIDVLMSMGKDPEALDLYYSRQEDIEEAIEAMSGQTINP